MKRRFVNRRTLLMVLLLLVGGAIVNVAVAWASAWAIKPREITSHQHQDWAVAIYESLAAGRVLALHNPGNAGASMTTTFPWWSNWPDDLKNSDPTWNINARWHMVEVRGWPMFALRSEHLRQGWVSGIALAPRTSAPTVPRALPVDPIWPGFAINTVFYAVILWGLFAVPFALRRRARIRRGLCPACAYKVGESPICTECGKPVTPLDQTRDSERKTSL